jgi:peptidoglycan/LPS O-acetylase OafA/YrhL
MQTHSLNYRPDIDGLRAFAVLAVVGFHAFPELLQSGFIGVDIFFVVSGYLIGRIIFSSLQKGTFSFSEFYSRRIRRIFPALAVVLIACLGFGWMVLLPDELAQLGKHAGSGSAFFINFVLNRESGYFDNAAETKPLLHLWSLAIEEQFYIIAPLVWVISARFRHGLLAVTLLAIVASFFANVVLIGEHSKQVFFLPFTRVWELLAGAILAYWAIFYSRLVPGPKIACVQSFAGIALLVVGMGFITDKSLFPGWWALLPVCGTLALISAGDQTWFNRHILSSRLLVGIGLISYPLYLWHHPLLSFATILSGKTPALEQRVALVVASFILAWLTYVMVERPIRLKLKAPHVVPVLALIMLVIGAVGYAIYQHGDLRDNQRGWMTEKHQGDIGHDLFFSTIVGRYFPCEPSDVRELSLVWKETLKRCFQSHPGTQRDIALIGDSHAEHLFPGLADALPNHNVVTYIHKWKTLDADDRMKRVIDVVSSEKELNTVILGWNWTMRLARVSGPAELQKELEWLVGKLLGEGKNVFLHYGAPNFTFSPSTCKYDRLLVNGASCRDARTRFDEQSAAYVPILQAVKKRYPTITLMDVAEDFCDAKYCYMAHENALLYRDNNHFGLSGSAFAAKRLLAKYPALAHVP